ncbi:MAG: DUF349 domain-containing protein [Granulosicoccus sp.]
MKNFLKTAAHQHKDPQVRLGYVNEVEAGADDAQEALCLIAREDPDLAVRLAAIEKINDLNVLRELLDASSDDADQLSDAAEARLVSKLTEGRVSDVAVRALLSTHAARLAVPIASHCSIVEQREMALLALKDEPSLVTVVQRSRFHDTRLASALRLTHHDALRSALSAVRSRDKVVAKQLQQRLDAEAAAEAALIARRHAVNTTLQSTQSLSDGVWTPQHAGKLQALSEKWASLTPEDREEHEASFAQAISSAEQKLQNYTLENAERNKDDTPKAQDCSEPDSGAASPDELSASVPAAKPSNDQPTPEPIDDPALVPVMQKLADSSIEQLSERLTALGDSNGKDAENVSEPVQQLLAYGHAVTVLFDPPYDLHKARPGALQQRIKRVSALLDTPRVLPGIDVSEHNYVKELASHAGILEDRLGKAKQESADRIKATHRQFAALSGIIKEGKWGPANSMMRRLKKKIDAMEASERTSLNEKLERAEKQLSEMADWQDFAARPKLEALCESMEALPALELGPEELARKVRELQGAWKTLGVSRASNDLWSRFKTAGDTAYEPCKAWFDNKQKERKQKLDAKAALCDALETELDSLTGETDWRAVFKRVNNAKREWSRNRVPDRKPDKALEARFSAALKPFETGLAEQYEANAAAKQELVAKVQALAEAEITQHAANQAKSLLSAWKLVGIMRRKEDQALWEVFNGHLGTIFKHQHKVERDKQRAGLEHVFRAKDIIKRLKALARADSLEEGEVQTLSTEFLALAEFPERDKKFLLRDYRQAMDACSRVQENASKRRLQAGHEETRRLVGLCEQLEVAIETPDAVADTLIDDISHAWDASEVKVQADLDSALKTRRDLALGHIKAGTQPDYEANETLRRDLLIRMEVAAGVDTPAEDKSRRMQYQLENLQQGMTSAGIDDAKQTLKKLEHQWIKAGPVKSAVRDALNSRFLKAYHR